MPLDKIEAACGRRPNDWCALVEKKRRGRMPVVAILLWPRSLVAKGCAVSARLDGLREKLREFFRQEVRAELRAVAALNNVELITALL